MSHRTDSAVESLKRRFLAAWNSLCNVPGEAVYHDIVTRYAHGRYYHDFGHIEAMFAMADLVVPDVRLSPELVLAIFLHDAEYDPRRHDNELRSALLARELLADAPPASVERIERLILATDAHESDDPECQLLIDLDLCFLGAAPDVFEANVDKLIREFSHLPPEQFLHGQASYLKPFLEREHIFYTAPFRQRFESQAKANLRRFIRSHQESP